MLAASTQYIQRQTALPGHCKRLHAAMVALCVARAVCTINHDYQGHTQGVMKPTTNHIVSHLINCLV